ncbi:hypothetical protein GHK58_06495 [Sinorhizobium meliloti]|nr:hypothetical protein [Sinorhizobium meliloti]
MLAIGQRNAPELSENAKPEFVVRLSAIDVGLKRAMSHGRCGISTVELYSGFYGALLIEIACKDVFHAVINHFSSMLLALACLSHEARALISPRDGCSTSCKRSTQDDRCVDLNQAVIEEKAKPTPREVYFLTPGDQRHVLLSLLNRLARHRGQLGKYCHPHEVFPC